MPECVIQAETNFFDIIVPTVDTVRSNYILEMLVKNRKQVGCTNNLIH